MEIGEVTACGFLVASGDGAPFLRYCPQVLDPVPPSADIMIVGHGRMGWIGRRNRFCAQGSDLVAPVSRGIGAVTNDLIETPFQPSQQAGRGLEHGRLTR